MDQRTNPKGRTSWLILGLSSVLTFSWQQRSGPSMTLDGANTVQPSFVPAEDGFYEFALTIWAPTKRANNHGVVRIRCLGGKRQEAHP